MSDGGGRNQSRPKVSPWPYITVALIFAALGFGGYGVIQWREAESKAEEARKREEETRKRADEISAPFPTAPAVPTVSAPLTASASASPTSGVAPLTVSFNATASGGTLPYTYSWSFGDGKDSQEEDPTHVFGSVTGNYSVLLQVTDCNGNLVIENVLVTVRAAPARRK